MKALTDTGLAALRTNLDAEIGTFVFFALTWLYR